LLQANGLPIELSLAFTCRQIAHEMNGLALSTHKIAFSTFFSEATRKEAGLFGIAIRHKQDVQFRALKYLMQALLTPEAAQIAKERYPMFAPIVDLLVQHESVWRFFQFRDNCGEPMSLFTDFVKFTFKLLSEHPDFLKKAKAQPGFFANSVQYLRTFLPSTPVCLSNAKDRAEFCASRAYNATLHFTDDSIEPWDILDGQELQDFTESWVTEDILYMCFHEYTKYPYSAASQAIRFFKSLRKPVLFQLRNVVLREDFESVASPECHGRGLIPICTENPHLRVERIVSLWHNVFPVLQWAYTHENRESRHVNDPWWLRNDKLLSQQITKSVGAWITEALLLPDLGMPKDSYTLVLDGSPTPEKSTAVFDIVQRDVAWQTLDICYARGSVRKPSWYERRYQLGYHYEILPTAMKNMSMSSPLIRCNFDPGLPHSAEALADAHSGWSHHEWWYGWAKHEPKSFETETPLPPWYMLRWHRVV
jgi:hypothetical protein